MKHIPEEDEARIRELAEEYNVPLYVVRSLYDVMPNELYDGSSSRSKTWKPKVGMRRSRG